MDNIKVCCICGGSFEGYGNNPYPVKSEGRCCDNCNEQFVLMERLFSVTKENTNDDR